MNYRLHNRIDAVFREQLEAEADLAYANSPIRVWHKEHGVRLVERVDFTMAMLEQAWATRDLPPPLACRSAPDSFVSTQTGLCVI